MNNTPAKLRRKWASDPPAVCMRRDENCSGRMTKEHALLYAGRQVQEDWAILDLCWAHHLGEFLNKRENIRIAMARATPEDLLEFPRQTWRVPNTK